jgi:FkbM family methyltransferase
MNLAEIVRLADRRGWRWMSAFFVFIIFVVKGERVRKVFFNRDIGLWQYVIGNSVFVSERASWFCSDRYFLEQFKCYSGHAYTPEKGETVIDVGAGVGEEVLPLAQLVGDSGAVHAIEANPRTFRVLKELVAANKFSQVRVHQVAISNTVGFTQIEDEVSYGVQNSIGVGSQNLVAVPCITLDEFIRQHKITCVDLLKVNIEGAEQLLVQGFLESIPRVRHISISCHDFRYHNGEDVFFKTLDIVEKALSPFFLLSRQYSGDPVRDHYVYGKNKLIYAGTG